MARRARARSSPEPSEEPEAASSAADAASSDDDSSSDSEHVEVEPNLATRSRRSNAGARMQALIEDEASAKVETEEMFREEENDEEFEQKEEKDEFDSDFGSTDEDAGDEEDDEEAGEKRLQREAKEAKKAERTKKKKGFQAPVHPFARQTKAARKKAAAAAVASTSATTLDGGAEEGGDEPPKKKKKVAIDPALYAPQRESTRRTAVESRRQVQERLKETEQRKAVAPKQTKKATRTLTQADLIAEALETEEKNRAALLAFYAAEEDRREQERIAGMRYEIIGPKLTFLSRVQGRVDKGKGKEEKMEKGRKRLIEVIGESGQKGWKAGGAETGGAVAGPSGSTRSNAVAKPSTSASLNGILNPIDADSITSQPPESQEYCRNWLIFDQFEGSRGEELEALFGDHVDWTKPPPMPKNGTKHTLCPITGLIARYRDPRTLTPYGTLSAFRTLNAIVDHQAFIWSDSLSAYTGTTGFGLMRDVEKSWSKRPLPPGSRLMYAVATPPPVNPAMAKGKARATGQGYPQQQQRPQVENPYKIEYAHAGGSGRGQRGRSSLPADPAAQYPAPPQNTLPPPPAGAQLPPLPPAPAQPPLPAFPAQPPFPSPNGAQAQYAPHPMVGASQAPQARSIQLGSGKSAFGPPQGQ
ncbi:hypothetical protein NBRC10512_001731 [Rhodotorula toruloides]|uniref:RHTO0S07e01046g1_1 n=1 Tax=Rhodotorula toruloides TaxID=5286 RepID=A0A061B6N8_RHOTO|nr:Vacuolar protein sorting-associated protein 72 [Rhodotorula toruloides]CDR42553.1 RHTO0S07e01046g1_1 [Rhodotorula toruloides]